MQMAIGMFDFARVTVTAAVAVAAVSGCATSGQPQDVWDPLEKVNRAVYSFNDAIDSAVLRPVAKGYDKVLPDPVKSGVANFFNNAFEPTVVINDVLQGKPGQALSDAGRFVVNTTIGVVGIFDVARTMGMERHVEDFGQTFAKWGFAPGPYLVLPFLGPSNLRDATGTGIYFAYTYPFSNIEDDTARYSVYALELINYRVQLLGTSDVIDQAALDPYVFVREAYNQRRIDLIYDGNPPLPALPME